MIPVLSEVQAMHNPALGAALVWRFACGYCPENASTEGTPLPLAFVVLPVVLHGVTCEAISATHVASGVRKFEEKFSGQGDVLYALNDRAIAMRPLSLRSVRLAVGSGLLTLLADQAVLWPRTYSMPGSVQQSERALLKAAEKLGSWCAALTLFELSGILRVEF